MKKIKHFLLIAVLLCSFRSGYSQSPLLKADSLYVMLFPDLPETMFHQIIDSTAKTKMSYYLPKNYNREKKYPLLLWLNGSTGGPGTDIGYARNLTHDSDFICVNLPLFIDSLSALEPDSSNYWSRMYIYKQGAIVKNWSCFKIMLDTLFNRIQNIDKKHCFMGGFSNGAHVTAGILNLPKAEIKNYFTGFYFMEGGQAFSNYSVLKNHPLLIMLGDKHGWKHDEEEQFIQSSNIQFAEAKKEGVDAEMLVGKGIGHEMAPVFTAKLRNWLRGKKTK